MMLTRADENMYVSYFYLRSAVDIPACYENKHSYRGILSHGLVTEWSKIGGGHQKVRVGTETRNKHISGSLVDINFATNLREQ